MRAVIGNTCFHAGKSSGLDHVYKNNPLNTSHVKIQNQINIRICEQTVRRERETEREREREKKRPRVRQRERVQEVQNRAYPCQVWA